MLNTEQWSTIRSLVAWLDATNGRSDEETTLRILKLTEEVGEVAQAWIGVTGQNPRKGVTHTSVDVADELCDVIVTALVALSSVVDDPAGHLNAKLAKIAVRPRTPAAADGQPCDHQFAVTPPRGSMGRPGDCTGCGMTYDQARTEHAAAANPSDDTDTDTRAA
jgi:NTP pyrophosphatase (non-canonical NTP hydrolase)